MTKRAEQKQVKRILVVEDEPFIALGLEQLLPRLGYEVAGVATHLNDALAKAQAWAGAGFSETSLSATF